MSTNHQEKIIQDGIWKVFQINNRVDLIVGSNVICRNFENFPVSSGTLILHDGVLSITLVVLTVWKELKSGPVP